MGRATGTKKCVKCGVKLVFENTWGWFGHVHKKDCTTTSAGFCKKHGARAMRTSPHPLAGCRFLFGCYGEWPKRTKTSKTK